MILLLWQLFTTFLMVGFVSFGGGYAMIPIIEREVVTNHQWMTAIEFSNCIAVAGMSPGPIAANSAIFAGYQIAGTAGAISAALGVMLPSLIIILIVARFFYRLQKNKTLKSAFYGLRPIITGLIIYAAIGFAWKNGVISTTLTWKGVAMILIGAAAFYAMVKLRMHPAAVIVLSGMTGIVLFG